MYCFDLSTKSSCKVANFNWETEKKALEQFQAVLQAAPSLGPYDPTDAVIFEVSVATRSAV